MAHRANFNASDVGYANGQTLDIEAEGVQSGSFTAAEVDGTIFISDYRFGYTAQTSPAFGDLGIYSAAITRAFGTAIFFTVSRNQTDKTTLFQINDTGNIALANNLFRVNYGSGGVVQVVSYSAAATGESYIGNVTTYSTFGEYEHCIMMGGYNASGQMWRTGETESNYTYGFTWFIRGDKYDRWTRLYSDLRNNAASVYFGISNYDGVGNADNLETLAGMGAILEPTDYDLAPAANDTFTHTADFFLEFVVATRPSSGNIDVLFRIQDASNYWILRITSAGAIQLIEVVATSPTTRASGAGIVTGNRIICYAIDDDIVVNGGGVGDIGIFTYASATNFKTETAAELDDTGTGGAVTNLAFYPATADAYDSTLVYTDQKWQSRKTVLIGDVAHEDGVSHEPVVIYDNDPQILAGPWVYKMWYGAGTSGGSGYSINYAESADGESWTKYGSNPVLADYLRPSVMKAGGTYHLYCVPLTGGTANQEIDYYTSSDGLSWSLNTDAVISVGAGGQWDDNIIGQLFVWLDDGNDWKMLYEGKKTTTEMDLGLATSADGQSWTKYASNPVVTGAGTIGGPYVLKLGTTYYAWIKLSTSTLPIDIHLYTSSDLVTWTKQPSFHMRRQFTDEGQSSAVGQLSDAHIVEAGTETWLYLDTSIVGSTAEHIKKATYYGTVVDLVGAAVPVAPSQLTANAVGGTAINLAWTDNSSDETGFKIYQSSTGLGGFSLIHTTAADVTSYQSAGLAPLTAYDYYIVATNAGGDSNSSNYANETTDAAIYMTLMGGYWPVAG